MANPLSKHNRKKLLLFLAVMGPGIITACADNDAGGIATYSTVGATYGYSLLWILFAITFSLALLQEMCARMGAVTGKGLSDLIREEFGIRWTFFAMLVLLVANVAVTIADFAGIAASLEIFGITRYVSVPVAALVIWLVIIKGSYRIMEYIFFVFSAFQLCYVLAGSLAPVDWGLALRSLVIPSFRMDPGYLMLVVAMIGTTITPWMQFYIQASVVDKGITAKQYKYEKADVLFGAFVTDFISFFIIVTCAATLFSHGIRVESAQDAALALAPISSRLASALFAIGLFGASILTASIVPLSTAYAVSEAFGFESGVSKRWSEAPVFFGLFTSMILIGAGAVLWPGLSLIKVMILSETVNGILLPVILVFILLLINRPEVMGKHVNGRIYNTVSWATTAGIILLTILLLVTTLFPVMRGF